MAFGILHLLPVELLDRILQYNASHHVIDLWKCGDRRLNFLLENGGVTRVRLEDQSAQSPSRWPRMLKFLKKLRFLSVKRAEGRLDHPHIIRNELKKLSPTLEKLKLMCYDADEVFLEEVHLEALLPVLFEPSQEFKASLLLDPAYKHACSKRRMWPMEEVFPKLRSLTITCTKVFDRPLFEICGLPESLTSLKMCCRPDWVMRDASSLPRGLQLLKFNRMKICGKHTLSTFPPGLVSLLGSIISSERNLDWINGLPKSITKLEGWIPWGTPFSSIYPPPSITSLYLSSTNSNLSVEWIEERIPKNLEELNLSAVSTPIGEELLRAMPTSLKSLSIAQNLLFPIDPSCFPIRLAHLDLPRSYLVKFEQLAILPRSLTSLTLSMQNFFPPEESFEDLPRGLKKLNLTDGAVIRLNSDDSSISRLPILHLPPGLLEIDGLHAAIKLEDFENGSEALIKQMPRGLKGMKVDLVFVDASTFAKELQTALRVSRYTLYIIANATSAYLSSKGQTNQPIGHLSSATVSALPPHLRSLKMHGNCVIPGSNYILLPRTLTVLDFGSSNNKFHPIEPQHLASLPSFLSSYYCSCKLSFEPSETIHPPPWTAYLPRALRNISVTFPISGSDFAHFPRTLRSIHTGTAYNVTSAHLQALPRQLSYLRTEMMFQPSSHPPCPSDLPPCLSSADIGSNGLIWKKHRSWAHVVRALPLQTPAPTYPFHALNPPPSSFNSPQLSPTNHSDPSLLIDQLQISQ